MYLDLNLIIFLTCPFVRGLFGRIARFVGPDRSKIVILYYIINSNIRIRVAVAVATVDDIGG
jgi:hypothetical protein